MKKLYLFDFDGTLTKRDTMFLFLRFYNRSTFNYQFIKHIPLFVLLKLKLAEAEKVKRSFISSVLEGEKKIYIEQKAREFFDIFYPEIIRENALDFIRQMDRKNTDCFIVTASLDIWVQPFAEKFQMGLIATEAEFDKDEVFRGRFKSANCNGAEKLKRIENQIVRASYDKVIAFGDTAGDRPMMAWADEGHYRFFH